MARVVALAHRQHGVVHVRQVAALGVSVRTMQRLTERGWERLHRGVYALPGSSHSDHRGSAAALLAAGEEAVIASWTAARLWGLTNARRWPIRVAVPHGMHRPRLQGVRITTTRVLTSADVTNRNGLRLTSPERTLCDVAAECADAELAELVATAVQLRLTTAERVEDTRRRLGPRAGSARLRAVLTALAEQGHTDSGLERDARRMLARAGLRPAAGTYPLHLPDGSVVHLDIAFPEQRVAIEVDGFAWHRTPQQLQRDHERQNRILAAGWRVLRLSAADIRAPERFLDQLIRTLSGEV